LCTLSNIFHCKKNRVRAYIITKYLPGIQQNYFVTIGTSSLPQDMGGF
jgi:hypothetical protein